VKTPSLYDQAFIMVLRNLNSKFIVKSEIKTLPFVIQIDFTKIGSLNYQPAIMFRRREAKFEGKNKYILKILNLQLKYLIIITYM